MRLPGKLPLLAPGSQVGRVNAFPAQQGADVARRDARVGSGQYVQLLGFGERASFGSGDNLGVRAWRLGYKRADIDIGVCWSANLILSVVHVGNLPVYSKLIG
jgi:hypothetical protein